MKHGNIRNLQRRGQAYWYEDGLWELVIGVLFVFYAAYYGVVGILPEESSVRSVMNVGYVIFVPGAMMIASWVVRKLKERISSPRTGYVAMARRGRQILGTILLAAVVAGITVAGALLIEALYVPVLVGGVGMAFGFGFTAYRMGLPRMVIAAIVSLIAGFALSVSTDNPETAFSFLFGFVGLVTAILGAATFIRYLRHNPVPEEQEGSEA